MRLYVKADTLYLDFHFYAIGKFQLHQGVDRFGCSAVNVEQPFIGAELKLFSGFFVDKRTPKHSVNLTVGWQGNRSIDNSSG